MMIRTTKQPSRQVIAGLVAVATGLTVATIPPAAAQDDANESTSCPAVHMLLAPGTSETARWADPNTDSHGFLSNEVAKPILNGSNDGQVPDLGAGLSKLLELPDAVGSAQASSSSGASAHSSAESSTSSDEVVQRVSRTYVTYPSTAGGVAMPGMSKNAGDATSYEDSVATGVEMTEDLAGKIALRCPDTKIFLTGYSQGAEVMSAVARRSGAGQSYLEPDSVAGVALFADPTRDGGTPLQPGGDSSPGPVPGAEGDSVSQVVSGLEEMTTPDARGLSTDKTGIDGFGELQDRTVSWCLMGDYVCGLPADSELTNDIVTILERMSLADPVKTLRGVGDVLDRAVKVGDISEVANFDFGDDGFSTTAEDAAETPVLTERVAAQKDPELAEDADSSTTSSTTSSATDEETDATGDSGSSEASESAEAAETTDPSESAGVQPGTGDDASSTSSAEPSSETSSATSTASETTSESTEPSAASTPSKTSEPAETPDNGSADGPADVKIPGVGSVPGPGPMPDVPEVPGMPGAAGMINDTVDKVVPVAAGLGGMALGAGITVAKRTLTPENIAQIGMAGISGGPQAAGAIAAAKLTESGMTLLEPASASGYARDVLDLLDDNDIPVADEVKLAVNLSSWMSLTEHIAYAERAMLPDGRSAAQATTDWVQAIASDLTADSDTPMDTSGISDLVDVGTSVLAEVDFNDELADHAKTTLAELAK